MSGKGEIVKTFRNSLEVFKHYGVKLREEPKIIIILPKEGGTIIIPQEPEDYKDLYKQSEIPKNLLRV